MIICDSPQGSPEWFQDRAGAITGSMFGEIMKTADGLTEQQRLYVDAIRAGHEAATAKKMAGYKSAPKSEKIDLALAGERVGDWTSAAKDYAFRLAIERNSGKALTDDNFQTYAMRRGHELEPEARALHAFEYGLRIDLCGFIKTDDGKFGVSADGLIGNDGGSEYKCFVDPAKLRSILIDKDIGDVIWQVQGGMWLTGRKWWHFGLYCPDLDPALELIPFERGEAMIEELEQELVAFDRLVEDYRQALLRRKAA